jgi:NADH:ubiquinone oxidoreductase subunit 3 (subunit A)
MNADWLVTPPVALALFLGVTLGLYGLAGRWAARGQDSAGKHLPYACGEDLSPERVKLSYHGFFRLALMFIIVHLATLVLAMLPGVQGARLPATLYRIGVWVCVDVLVRGED